MLRWRDQLPTESAPASTAPSTRERRVPPVAVHGAGRGSRGSVRRGRARCRAPARRRDGGLPRRPAHDRGIAPRDQRGARGHVLRGARGRDARPRGRATRRSAAPRRSSTCRRTSSIPGAGIARRRARWKGSCAWSTPTGGRVRSIPRDRRGRVGEPRVRYQRDRDRIAHVNAGNRRDQRAHQPADRDRTRGHRSVRRHRPGADAHDRPPERARRAGHDERDEHDARAVRVEGVHAVGAADCRVTHRRLVPRRRRDRLPVLGTRACTRPARRRRAQGPRWSGPRRVGGRGLAARHRAGSRGLPRRHVRRVPLRLRARS